MRRSQGSRRSGKVPRSYRAGNLLTLLDSDLPDHTLERHSGSSGRLIPRKRGLPALNVDERVLKNFLGHITVVVFSHRLSTTQKGPGKVRIEVTGAIKPTGVVAKVIEGGETAESLAAGLDEDRRFVEPALALDFKRFELIGDEEGWVAEVELIGASQVVTALPPMRRYIRLYPDQRNALLSAFRALDRVLGRS